MSLFTGFLGNLKAMLDLQASGSFSQAGICSIPFSFSCVLHLKPAVEEEEAERILTCLAVGNSPAVFPWHDLSQGTLHV